MRRIKRKPLAEINVVPYIDVMLVLLVIFMITAPMLTQGVKVALPQAEASVIDSSSEPPLIISINEKGLYFINDENQQNDALSLQNILVRVLAEIKLSQSNGIKKTLLVRGDKTVPYGDVIYLMATLKQAGIKEVGLMTEPPLTQGDAK